MRLCDRCRKGDQFFEEEVLHVGPIGFVQGIDLCRTCLAGLSQTIFDFVWPGEYEVRPDGKINYRPTKKTLVAYPNPLGEGIIVSEDTDGR